LSKSLKEEILYFEMSNLGIQRFGYKHMFIEGENFLFVGHTAPMYMANKAWWYNKRTSEIRWAKNRDRGIMAPLDKREFFIVQLAAMPIKTKWL
jgi:hypothetical protein